MSERIRPIYETSPEQQLHSGEVVLVRDIVDRDTVTSRADELISNHSKLEWDSLPGEDYHNAVTSLFEELRAAGDLSEIDFEGDQAEIHAATIARLLNAYKAEGVPLWEQKRRYAEICEELSVYEVFIKIANKQLPADTLFVTFSDFPDDAGSLEEAHDIGYRAGNRKGMLRSYSFSINETGGWVRHLEQLSQSNAVTSDRTRGWFNQNAAAVPLHSTGALAEQFLTTKQRLPDGVVTLVQELDEQSNETLRYGESVSTAIGNRPSYERIRGVSLAERQREHHFVKELELWEAELSSMLHAGQIDYQEKLSLFHGKQSEIVDRILLQAPKKYAVDARGATAAEFYESAHQAALAGDLYAAKMNLSFAHQSKDRLSGGSCGGSGKKKEFELLVEDLGNLDRILENFDQDLESRDESSWEWKTGYCRVESCENKGKATEVGPCNVCRDCQYKFDHAIDPTKQASKQTKEIEGGGKRWKIMSLLEMLDDSMLKI